MKIRKACEIRDVLCKDSLSELSRITHKFRTLDEKEMSGKLGTVQREERNQASGAEGYKTVKTR